LFVAEKVFSQVSDAGVAELLVYPLIEIGILDGGKRAVMVVARHIGTRLDRDNEG
jgi:hypothetical protein